jgi:hypothetical protein
MTVPIVGAAIDERFLTHRLRSTSFAAMAGGAMAGGLALYRLYVQHVWSWDLFAVLAAMVVAKLGLMAWLHFND